MTPIRYPVRRRAFAMLTAIALIALVAVAMAAAASVFRLDARRTMATLDDAQLRQLLRAGERVARARLGAGQAPATTAGDAIPLPPLLAAEGASLTLRLGPASAGDSAVVVVEAESERRTLFQTLHYTRLGGTWTLSAADLGHSARRPQS